MPAPTPPGVVPIWTQGNTSVRTQPTNGEQFAGFVPNFRPPSSWHNWLFGIFSDWIQYLSYAIQGNGPVSNVGHNILVGTTVQQQFDETDAFLSSLGLQKLTMDATSNPLVYTVTPLPLNGAYPLIFIDGVDQDPSVDFTFAVVSGTGTVTFAVAPSPGQTPWAIALTANNPGSGGTSVAGGYVSYGNASTGVSIVPSAGVTSTSDQRAMIFTVPSIPGINMVTATPQISAGTKVGQELVLVGTSNSNALVFSDGNGLALNGPVTLEMGESISLYWNGLVWAEQDRSN